MDQSPPVPPPPPGTSLFEMDLDAAGQNHLNSGSKWGKFISITLLILILLCVLALATQYNKIIESFRSLISLDNRAAGFILAVLVIFFAFIFLILFYLLRGCSQIKRGLVAQNSDKIADGFKSLKV